MKNDDLTKGDIPRQIKKIAIPASVGFFFNTMYNVVDTYFGGLVSTDALAALSLSFPVFFVIIAMGLGVATGATALIANALGAKDQNLAKTYSFQAITFSIIISLILTVVGFYISPFLFKLLGAEGEYLQIAVSYVNVIFIGSVFLGLTFVINGILNAQGDTKTFRDFLVLGFFLNLLLNPMLMFGWLGLPALGLAGVAWATLIIQIIGVFYMTRVLIKKGILCSGCNHLFYPQLKYFKELARQGFPASLNMLTVAVGIFVITYFISPFGKTAIAAYGIATRIDQIALLPSIGLNVAALSLIGQNNGAKKFERCQEIYRTVMKYGLIVSSFGIVGVLFLTEKLMALFTKDAEVIAIGSHYLLISVLVYWAYAILFMLTSVLQGLRKPMFAVWIGLYRQIIAPLAFFYFFSRVLGWELNGIWWGIFAINWTAVVISYLYAKKVMREIFDK